jgi:hypothetical protein
MTRRLSTAYLNLVRGVDKGHPEWRTPVYAGSRVMAAAAS